MRKCCLDALCRRTSHDVKKLETLLDLTVSRLALLRSQSQTRCAQAEADVAQHLRRRQHARALIPAEKVIRERNRLDGFDIVESYCHLLKKPAFLEHKQKECPEELREAAAGLAYAALRCGDLPELRKIRRIFRSRFGREFTTAVAELRDNCGVGADLLRKFSTKQPSLEIRVEVMREIANEKGIEVDLAEIPVETVENPNLQTRTQQAKAALGRLCAACGILEPLGGEKLEIKDAGSAALAASESAAYATAEARTDVELYRSESERIGDHSSNPGKLLFTSASRCSSIDLGCRARKVSSLRNDLENPRGKEILNEIDESSDSDEELMRLASKTLVPVNRAQSFAGLREMDLKGKMGDLDSKNENGDKEDELEEVNEMAIVAVVEASKKGNRVAGNGFEQKVEAERNSLSRASSFSVRTRR